MSDAATGAGAGAAIGTAAGGPVGAAIGAGIGAIGGGIVDFFGQQSANDLNWQEFVSNQQFQQGMMANAQQYNTYMSNTSHQREMADLQKAGLNPILAANQGASTPTSPMATGGIGNAAQNPMAGLGRGLANAIPDAITAAKTIQDIGNTDADTTLKQASALTQAAQADRENASAQNLKQQTSESFARTQEDVARIPGITAESASAKIRADLDAQNSARERLMNQIRSGLQIGNSAKSLLNPLSLGGGGGGYSEQDLLNAAGGRGVLIQ